MDILSWVVLGLIAGFVAHLISPTQGMGGIIGTLILGILGALIGGYLGNLIFGVGVTGINFSSIIVAVIGSIIVLFIYKAIVRRTV